MKITMTIFLNEVCTGNESKILGKKRGKTEPVSMNQQWVSSQSGLEYFRSTGL